MFAALVAAAIAVTGCEGGAGPAGPPGKDGQSCTLTDNGNGTSTVTCPGGTSVTVPTGTQGTTCKLVLNADGTHTVTCTDGTSVVVTSAVVDYQVMTPDELKAAALVTSIKSVTIPADGRPVIVVKVTERHGLGVKGLATAQPDTDHPNPLLPISWRYALLKLDSNVNSSIDETWVSYMASSSTSTAGTENAAAPGFIDNGDGTYTYRFTRVINAGPSAAGTTYEPDKLHRLVILISGPISPSKPISPISPINVVRDFTPASLPIDFSAPDTVTGSHDKVDGAACLECHTTFRAIADGTGVFGTGEFHSGGRYDIRTCVACHNDQRRFTPLGPTQTGETVVGDAAIQANGTWTGKLAVVNGEATIDFPVFIHKIHMGNRLTLQGGTYAGVAQPYETTYPQDVRTCTKCHRSPAPMASHFQVPSRRACGACHDGTSFVNPPPAGRLLHKGGPRSDDTQCAVCHQPFAVGNSFRPEVHEPISPPNPNNIYANPASGNTNTNAAWVAAAGYVPPDAKALTYEVSKVALDASRHPQITFRIKMSAPTATPPVAPAPVVFQDPTKATELIPGFVGSPSAYFAYAIPQDGIAAPADFNASVSGYLRNIWNGSATGPGAGTLIGPDASGFYTVTLTGTTIPASAVMLTGGIGYTYSLGTLPAFSNHTQPFTEIDIPPLPNGDPRFPYTPNASGFAGTGGLIVPAPDVWKVADASGFTGRREIIDNKKCNACHVSLGVGPDFHAGQRNDAASCSFCHRPNQSSSGWAANAKDFIHSIHAAEKRTVPFNWHAESATEGFYNVTYPAILNRCEMCHVPGTYDFSKPDTISALPSMLPSTVGQGRYNSNAATNPSSSFMISPYVTSNNTVDYGFGFSTSNVGATLPDGISGTQNLGGTIVSCTPAAPCICSAASPCSVDLNGTYTVDNVPVSFTQKLAGGGSNNCNTVTCTCTTALPCTGVVASCSLSTPCQAQGTTLVTSPIAAACVACHDTPPAVDHMQTNGASIWEPRSTALTKPQKEECLICHGPNRLAGIVLVHTDRTP